MRHSDEKLNKPLRIQHSRCHNPTLHSSLDSKIKDEEHVLSKLHGRCIIEEDRKFPAKIQQALKFLHVRENSVCGENSPERSGRRLPPIGLQSPPSEENAAAALVHAVPFKISNVGKEGIPTRDVSYNLESDKSRKRIKTKLELEKEKIAATMSLMEPKQSERLPETLEKLTEIWKSLRNTNSLESAQAGCEYLLKSHLFKRVPKEFYEPQSIHDSLLDHNSPKFQNLESRISNKVAKDNFGVPSSRYEAKINKLNIRIN